MIPFGEWGNGCGSRGLALLGAVNTIEPDAFSAAVMQDFDGVAVEDGDDGAGEVGIGGQTEEQDKDSKGQPERHGMW